jgi:hypothetical protein
MNTACGHFDVENDALFSVYRSLLLVGRLDPRQTTPISVTSRCTTIADGDLGRYTCFYCSRQNSLEAFGP